MSAHKIGPWFAYPKSLQVADKRFWFAEDGSRHGETPNMLIDCMTEAECHLIAAAPDLLEALQLALPHLEAVALKDNAAYALARAALAKAGA